MKYPKIKPLEFVKQVFTSQMPS